MRDAPDKSDWREVVRPVVLSFVEPEALRPLSLPADVCSTTDRWTYGFVGGRVFDDGSDSVCCSWLDVAAGLPRGRVGELPRAGGLPGWGVGGAAPPKPNRVARTGCAGAVVPPMLVRGPCSNKNPRWETET